MGCILVGVFIDGFVKNLLLIKFGNINVNYVKIIIKDFEGFLFVKLGFEIDSVVIGLLKLKDKEL